MHAWLLAALVCGAAYSWQLPCWFPSTAYHGRAQLAGQVVVRPFVDDDVVYDGRVRVVPVLPLATPAGRLQALLLRVAPWSAPGALEVDVTYAGRWAVPDLPVRAGWRYDVIARHGACGARGAVRADVHAFAVARPTVTVPPCPS